MFPLVLALALAMLGLVPLGAGRTDIYLHPLLALAVALGIHHLADLDLRPAVLLLVVLGALSAASFRPTLAYPAEDLAPLVEELEALRQSHEAVLVYPHASFAFALYTKWPVYLVESRRFATGFESRVLREGVVIPEGTREDPATYEWSIDQIRRQYETVWFVVSHPGPDVPGIEQLLRSRGYLPGAERSRQGARLTRWVLTGA